MLHYWFSHRANSRLNVLSQWSKTDTIQPWPPSQTWQIEIKILGNKAAVPLADGGTAIKKLSSLYWFKSMHISCSYDCLNLWASMCPYVICNDMELLSSLCVALHGAWWPCCGVRCCLGENHTIGTQSQRQACWGKKEEQDSCIGHEGWRDRILHYTIMSSAD